MMGYIIFECVRLPPPCALRSVRADRQIGYTSHHSGVRSGVRLVRNGPEEDRQKLRKEKGSTLQSLDRLDAFLSRDRLLAICRGAVLGRFVRTRFLLNTTDSTLTVFVPSSGG